MRTSSNRSRQRGFNLIEVMAAVLVVAFGLLGLAKVQAMAVSDAATSGSRSIAAMQVQSLAAMMHANPGFWQTSSATASPCSVAGSSLSSCSTLSAYAGTNCLQPTATCSSSQMAAYDVQSWALSLSNLLPQFTATITCSTAENNAATTSGGTEYSCAVTMNWSEKFVALNKAVAQAGTGSGVTANYTTTVWP